MKRLAVWLMALCGMMTLFGSEYDLSKAKLIGGAVCADGVITLDGKKAYVILPGTEDCNITTSGLTLACSFKPVNERKSGDPAKDQDSYISKLGTPFTLCRSGYYISVRIRTAENKFLPPTVAGVGQNAAAGQWSHLAAVFAYDGKNLTCRLYLNGKKFVERTYENVVPATNNRPLDLGYGFGHDFCYAGDIAEVNIARRAMSDEEIAGLAASSKFIGK